MNVKKYVSNTVNESAKYREINIEGEVWNILYVLLHDYGIKHSDKVEDCNEYLKGFVESREFDFIHFYPEITK